MRRPVVTRGHGLVLAAALSLGACSSGIITSGAPEGAESAVVGTAANLTSLTCVVMRNPEEPQAYLVRGSVDGQSGQYKEAPADFNKAISLDPKYAQAYANRGLVHRQTGKLDLALADYNRALAIDPNYAAA